MGNFQLHAFIDGKHTSENTKFIFIWLWGGNAFLFLIIFLHKLALSWICILRAQA